MWNAYSCSDVVAKVDICILLWKYPVDKNMLQY